MKTKTELLREICKKFTGYESKGMTVAEVLKDISQHCDLQGHKCQGTTINEVLQHIDMFGDMEGTAIKDVISKTGCIAFPYSVATSFDEVLNEDNTDGLISAYRAFEGCTNLKNAPMMDTSNVINAMYMFYTCTALEVIPAYDFSKISGSLGYGMFYNCTSLKSILATGIAFDLDISASSNFTKEAYQTLISNLGFGENLTLTVSASGYDLFDSDMTSALSDKGWNLTHI